ncbi:CG16791 [Drosophila busckii]|uniref:CG16791 n=1 Tax=Drosophila busckii TaxID=30019 RepID=A0A0M4EGN6_DROBS|nr:CG16791 [Drosophila busckii]
MYYNNNNNNNNDTDIEQHTTQQQPGEPKEEQMQQATTIQATTTTTAARTWTLSSSSSSRSTGRATSTSKTRASSTSLIYLPPFCYPCGHVPEVSVEASSQMHNGNNNNNNNNNNNSDSCCWQRHRTLLHENYDKHATASTSTSTEFLLQRDMLSSPRAEHSCIDLRLATQLVMPIVVGGNGDAISSNVSECRRQRRERMRRERQSQQATNATNRTTNVSQTTTTATATATIEATALATTSASLVDLDGDGDVDVDVDVDEDECRCFNYNGDISALDRLTERLQTERKWYGLPSNITWLKLWQQLLLVLLGNVSAAATTTNRMTRRQEKQQQQQPAEFVASCSSSGNNNSMRSTKSWLAPLMLTLLLATSVGAWGGRQDAPTNCTFPARWEGSWFLSGYQQSIHIKGSQFSYRGRCAASDGNKYLIVDDCSYSIKSYYYYYYSYYYHYYYYYSIFCCYSFPISMYFCKGRETLQNLCDQIPGDALLYSLFRESAEPVKCPLKGPFIFTYNRGHGECKSPVSNIESCTEESRLLLSFQACPDVQGTESTVEELTCLATWKDGNSRYLVGLVSHHHAISNEERYRCFVYEKISSLMGGPSMLSSKDAEYKLAQSGDATCNGLDSAEVGSRIMSLRKPPVAERCDFPAWFKGPRHWHALMGNAVYNYHANDGSVHIIKPNGYMETRALCEQINKQTSTEMMAVVHYTTGCQSGFMCMMFYRRDTHVIEIQTGKPAIRLEDACAPDHFDFNKMSYITLLASNPELHICPMEGMYNLRGAIGPPYVVTRHKRNHNGKSHLGHGHHHHESADSGSFGHKGHSSLSFRNAERMERGSWHGNTRGLPVRSRRNAPPQAEAEALQQALVLNNDTSVGFIASRNRRDVPACVTNYNAQRQLQIGCSEANVIDVSPLCSVDGEEEYSCHGSWSENSTYYIIARHKGTKHGVCITYRPTEGNAAKLVVGDACYRGTQKPPDHHLVTNLSVFGKCGETGSSASCPKQLVNWLLSLGISLWVVLLS